ncbi:UDP-4-amino-4,6-dideoxy-N-acetyl-beta-L-altrosamine transaminase [Bacteroidota bacterium]
MIDKIIPYGRQEITDDDISAVVDILKSDFLTQGPKIAEFESVFANYIGVKYAVALSNGTAALHLSVLGLKIEKGHRVLTTPITFAATANSVIYSEGEISFVDIDPASYLIDLNRIENELKKDIHSRIKGIIPVDFAGFPVNLEDLKEMAEKYGQWILEDACHAPGGYFIDSEGIKQNCGNGAYADAAIFSFHPVKHITTGEGGMITTNNKELYEYLKLIRTHGITKEPGLMQANPGSWYYEMIELGYNYRLTDIQSALGLSQLNRAKTNLEKRQKIADRYDKAFSGVPEITKPARPNNGLHAFHLYIIQVNNRKELFDYLRNKGIYVQVHYIPLHHMPFYKNKRGSNGKLPETEQFYQRCLSLPMYPSLTENDLDFVIESIQHFYNQ